MADVCQKAFHGPALAEEGDPAVVSQKIPIDMPQVAAVTFM